MALSKSLPKGQFPIGCQLCEEGTIIKWSCKNCELLICDACKKVHLKIPATKDHKVVNIKDIDGNKSSEVNKFQIGFKVVKQYTVDIRHIGHMVVSPDWSLWIGDNKSKKILHIKLSSNSVTTMSSFNITPYGLAISPSGSPFIVVCGSTLKIMNEMTGQTINSKFTIHPLTIASVYTNRNNNIIVGGISGNKGAVIVMDSNGNEISKYEKDKDNTLFTYPECITATKNGNIFIIDKYQDNKGRVVRIKPGGDNVVYEGHPDINMDDKPFDPVSIIATPNDNVLIRNRNTDYLHILNNEGDFITYFNLIDIGVNSPYSLALSPSGNIYVGGANALSASKDSKAILYELEYFGV